MIAMTNAFVITERIPMPSRIPYQMPIQREGLNLIPDTTTEVISMKTTGVTNFQQSFPWVLPSSQILIPAMGSKNL